MKLVMKFGGTSMAGAERIRAAAAIARRWTDTHSVVVVVSAMDGVTEQLLDLSDSAGRGDRTACETLLATIRADHQRAANDLASSAGSAAGGAGGSVVARVDALLSSLDSLALGVVAVGECTARSRDAIVAFGERLSSVMMGAALGCDALDGAEAGIVTDEHFGEAEPLMDESMDGVRARIGSRVAPGAPLVVAGFIAATRRAVTSTLGRGGSDYTATILAAALGADEVWIWSDVDGLMSADPRVVPAARLLTHIAFDEAVEMGKFGAKSMHPRALEPAATYRVPVRMKNTFKPDGAGTLISDAPNAIDEATARDEASKPVRAVPALKNTAMITIGGAGMIGRPGSAAAIFDALGDARVNVHMICQSVSEAAISVVVSSGQLDRARAALGRAIASILGTSGQRRLAGQRPDAQSEASPESLAALASSHVHVVERVAIIAVIGRGMRGTPGIAARVFTAVAEERVNVIAIAQGSSELSIALAVAQDEAPRAVASLHRAFGLG
jgi:aspartate kinase